MPQIIHHIPFSFHYMLFSCKYVVNERGEYVYDNNRQMFSFSSYLNVFRDYFSGLVVVILLVFGMEFKIVFLFFYHHQHWYHLSFTFTELHGNLTHHHPPPTITTQRFLSLFLVLAEKRLSHPD